RGAHGPRAIRGRACRRRRIRAKSRPRRGRGGHPVERGRLGARAEPHSGRANHPDARLSIVRGSARLVPDVPWPGEVAFLRATVKNLGRREVAATRWRAEVAMRAGDGPGSEWSAAPVAIGPGATLAPGESAGVQ